MKEIYYYELTDDGGLTWTIGKPAFSLLNCLDMARKCSFPYRITKAHLGDHGQFVSFEDMDKALDELNILDKIFQ